jgi:hypothetical protein
MPTKVQYYADPIKFNKTGTGLVVASITINGQNYSPKLFIDNCTEGCNCTISGSENGRDYAYYKINMQNYFSLDAMMNNKPFAWEYWQGRIYAEDLKSGCNTLQVIENGGTQLYILAVR